MSQQNPPPEQTASPETTAKDAAKVTSPSASGQSDGPLSNAQLPDAQFPPVQNDGSENSDQWHYKGWLDNFSHWLRDSQSHEVKNLVAFFDRSSEWWLAVKDLTSDQFYTQSEYFKRDLMLFYHHYQKDLADSDFFQSLKESVWQELAEMTDKSKVEWRELALDFEHNGIYEAGEWVGMGILTCKNCHATMVFQHPTQLSACVECGHQYFVREALAP